MKEKILFNTFSFLLVIPLLLIMELLIEGYNSTGFIIGWLIGSTLGMFWRKPLYLDKMEVKNSELVIEFTNPLLKNGIEKLDLEKIRNIRLRNKTWLTKNRFVEFEFDGINKKFAFFKINQEEVLKGISELKNK